MGSLFSKRNLNKFQSKKVEYSVQPISEKVDISVPALYNKVNCFLALYFGVFRNNSLKNAEIPDAMIQNKQPTFPVFSFLQRTKTSTFSCRQGKSVIAGGTEPVGFPDGIQQQPVARVFSTGVLPVVSFCMKGGSGCNSNPCAFWGCRRFAAMRQTA